MMNSEIYNCAIIGAGFSGLAAATRLSHFGIKSVLLEKNANLGGLNTFYYKNGIEIDSGLHAMTNFSPRNGSKHLPLHKLLRQLRISHDELRLREQTQSEIRFPGSSIIFDNKFEKTLASFKNIFPNSASGLDELCKFISDYDAFSLEPETNIISARKKIAEFISDIRLVDMILLPLMFYGNARETDMELSQFIIMFRSVFMEGFCRPSDGIKRIISIFKNKLKNNSCEIRKRNAVLKIVQGDGIFKITLADGAIIKAKKIISCVGANETIQLCEPTIFPKVPDGELSFAEAIFCMEKGFKPKLEEYKNACLFFNETKSLEYKKPCDAFNIESGVLCCPDNFHYLEEEKPNYSFLRLTALAKHEDWLGLSDEKYSKLKQDFRDAALAKIAKLSGLQISNNDILFSDIFTPRTIVHWSGHKNGAIYGSPAKSRSGKTSVENLFICGTDQGFLGITGSILSGISIANKYGLEL